MPLRNPANLQRLATFLFVAIVTVCGRQSATPPSPAAPTSPAEFSLANAQSHVAKIATEPHPNASPANDRVRQYLLAELAKLNLNPHVHTGQSYGYTLKNITATLPGVAHTNRAILLAAHYDSVPKGPGASDDAAAVAALLETCRALKAGPPLRHDVRLVITDGEEFDLLGARAYFNDPNTADTRATIALALNFEARGTTGPAMMFETAPGNAALISHFAKADPRPLANSLSYDVYKLLRNDTDFTVHKQAGLQGLNFAFIGAYFNYHTANDTAANLNPASLYHQGQHALHLARHFANLPDADLAALTAPQGNAVYFNLCPAVLVRYPATWIWPLTIAQIALAALALHRAARAGLVTLRGVARAALRLLLAFIDTAAVACAFVLLLPAPMTPAAFTAQLILYVASGVAITAALAPGAPHKSTPANGAAVVLILMAVLAIVVSRFLPGGSFITLWPPLFATLALAAMVYTSPATWPRTLTCCIAVTPALIILVPMTELIFTALTLKLAVPLSALVVLMTWLVLAAVAPAFQAALPKRRSNPAG